MSYIALQNTCTASTLAKQTASNKPQYTPSKALKKAMKLLSRLFKSSTSTAKKIITAEPQVVIDLNDANCHNAQECTFDESIINHSSTLSLEESENELNELAELAALATLTAV